MSRTVIVTGSSSGIGLDIARGFIEAGDNVVLNGRDPAKLALVAATLGGKTVTVPGDASLPTTHEALVRAAVDTFGRIDVLVNNAGIFGAKPFLDVTPDDLDSYLTGNLKSTYFLTQAVVRQLIAQGGGGAIINISAGLLDHAITGFPASAPMASKGGVRGITTALAAELAPHDIRVNDVAPGIIRTPLIGPGADDYAGLAVLGRVGEVSETTAAVLYLADATFTTGHTLRVDGGYLTGRK